MMYCGERGGVFRCTFRHLGETDEAKMPMRKIEGPRIDWEVGRESEGACEIRARRLRPLIDYLIKSYHGVTSWLRLWILYSSAGMFRYWESTLSDPTRISKIKEVSEYLKSVCFWRQGFSAWRSTRRVVTDTKDRMRQCCVDSDRMESSLIASWAILDHTLYTCLTKSSWNHWRTCRGILILVNCVKHVHFRHQNCSDVRCMSLLP